MGGYSIQDIETRLRVIEDKVAFALNSLRMRAMITSGVLGPDGKPQGQVIDGTMLDFYHMSKTQSLPVINEGELPAEQDARIAEDLVNG